MLFIKCIAEKGDYAWFFECNYWSLLINLLGKIAHTIKHGDDDYIM